MDSNKSEKVGNDKIIAAGYGDQGNNRNITIARYNYDGSLDNLFGTGGVVFTDFGSGDYAYAIAVQSDGKIIVAGNSGDGWTIDSLILSRYNTDGSLDVSFGTGGKVIMGFGGTWASGWALTIENDAKSIRKIVVSGYTDNSLYNYYNIAVARYLNDGSLDTTFGVGGKVFTPIAGFSMTSGQSVVRQTDGKIVVAGYGTTSTDADFVVVRYLGDQSSNIEESKEAHGIMIYPNPATNNLTIETPAQSTIKILNIHGQLIKTLVAGITTLDISSLARGMYFLQVKTEKGVAVRKFIKE